MADNESDHPLLSPRIVVALALVGVWGTGVGLMAAKVVVIIGFVIAFSASIGIISLYFRSLRSAIKALTSTAVLEGPRPVELMLAISIVSAMIPLSIYLAYVGLYYSDANAPSARIEVSRIVPIIDDQQEVNNPIYHTKLFYRNTGSIQGTTPIVYSSLEFTTEAKMDTEAMLKDVQDGLDRLRRLKIHPEKINQVYQNEEYTTFLSDDPHSSSQVNNMMRGKAFLNAVIVMKYKDENTPAGYSRYTTFCGRPGLSFSGFSFCNGGNRTFIQKD